MLFLSSYDREAAIAEASETVTPTWTFHSLLQQLNPGAYDFYDDHRRAVVDQIGSRIPENAAGCLAASLISPREPPLAKHFRAPWCKERSNGNRTVCGRKNVAW